MRERIGEQGGERQRKRESWADRERKREQRERGRDELLSRQAKT